MAKVVHYKASVQKDLKGLGKTAAKKLLSAVEKKLSHTPPDAKALTGEFKGLFRVRVGDYRAIYTETSDGFLVLRIAHRREVYR